jgi:hypothetical protein
MNLLNLQKEGIVKFHEVSELEQYRVTKKEAISPHHHSIFQGGEHFFF